jgi:hypothetical protein
MSAMTVNVVTALNFSDALAAPESIPSTSTAAASRPRIRTDLLIAT